MVFGRQGAGKGTQCEVLSRHYGTPHISTGDMLRAAVESGSEFGRKAKSYMDAGQLLPDDVILGVVAERLAQPDVVVEGFLLDGFPRTLGQAEALANLVEVDVAVDLAVPEDEVRTRMLDRGRADDTPEVIDERLAAYARETVPVIQWYDRQGLLVSVDGVGDVEDISRRLIAAVDERLGDDRVQR